jgi:hypothetical protein
MNLKVATGAAVLVIAALSPASATAAPTHRSPDAQFISAARQINDPVVDKNTDKGLIGYAHSLCARFTHGESRSRLVTATARFDIRQSTARALVRDAISAYCD